MKFNLKERLQNLKMVAALATFLKDPGSLDSVFAVAGSLKDSPLGDQMVQHLLADPQFRSLVDEGWRPQPIDLQQLQILPKGSLGRCYADQLINQGITPDTLIDPSLVTSAQEFVVHRLKETHDIVHVLTGFWNNKQCYHPQTEKSLCKLIETIHLGAATSARHVMLQ